MVRTKIHIVFQTCAAAALKVCDVLLLKALVCDDGHCLRIFRESGCSRNDVVFCGDDDVFVFVFIVFVSIVWVGRVVGSGCLILVRS